MTAPKTLEGRFERVIWQARDSGDFKVCTFALVSEANVEGGKREVIVKGHIPSRLHHCDVKINVSTVHSDRYGKQYRYESLEALSLPRSLVGFVNYMKANHGLSSKVSHALYKQLHGNPYTHLDRIVAELCDNKPPYDTLKTLENDTGLGRVLQRVAAPLFIPKLLGARKVFALLMSWAKLKQGDHLEAWLHTLGFTGTDIERVTTLATSRKQACTEGAEHGIALSTLKENPYLLCSTLGFAFHNIDAMACEHVFNGAIPLTDPRRVQAALMHGIQRSCFLDGHVCLPLNMLCESAFRLLRQCRHVVESVTDKVLSQALVEAVHALRKTIVPLHTLYDPLHTVFATAKAQPSSAKLTNLQTPHLIVKHVGGATYASHPLVWHREKHMARTLHYIQHDHYARFHVEPDTIVQQCQRDHGFAPDASQIQALAMLCTQSLVLLRGGAGTGKTTLMHTLVSLCTQADMHCILAAPTGVAAKRMEERTGHTAHTIHSLVAQWVRLVPRGNAMATFILDEMSMVDVAIFAAFLAALQQACDDGLHAKLVLVGDPQQLPPVGPGQVYVAMLAAKTIPICTLDVVHRQKQGGLIDTATRIIHADRRVADLPATPTPTYPYVTACMPVARHTAELTRFGTRQALETLMQLLSGGLVRVGRSRDFARVQILCAIKQGKLGKHALNQRLQTIFNPAKQNQLTLSNEATQPELLWHFRIGDKVMYTHNDYTLGARNGQQGFVTALDAKTKSITVDFALSANRNDGQNKCLTFSKAKWQAYLEPSYAMTIHKSQGSEYNTTFIFLPNAKSAVMRRFLDRRLFYTALTRTKRKCYLFAEDDALNATLQNTQYVKRYSLLAGVLRTISKR